MIIIVFAMMNQSFAQINFALKGGLNLANISTKSKIFNYSGDAKKKLVFHLGFAAEFPILEKYAIETGLLFSKKGIRFEDSYTSASVDLNYMDFYIHAKRILDFGYMNVFIYAGPYRAYAI